MAKTKNKKKNLSEITAAKKLRETKKKSNPFEIHINKNKHNVLGRKNKADRGLPGVARSKAIHKRKHTLLHEFSQKDKDNLFMDKRIGEKMSGMTAEEKAMARFAAARIKAHKKNIFNLHDDEVLTHRGQTLEEIEKFEDPRSDDDLSDVEDAKGHLNKQFVDDAHFGGGILSKPNASLSRKDVIEQLIAESKKRKVEKQKIREETIDLTEKLDSQWHDLIPIIARSKATAEERQVKSKIDDFDRTVRELKFESRGQPCDRLKSEEEIVKEEKDKLEALEQDRLARMKGSNNDASSRTNHKSADDLDDGFAVEEINEQPLAYDDDGVVVKSDFKDDKFDENEDEVVDNENSDNSEEEENYSEDENTAANILLNLSNGLEKNLENSEVEKTVETNITNDEDEDDSNDGDNLSDLKASDSSSDDEEQPNENKTEKKSSTIKIIEDKSVNILTNGKLNVKMLRKCININDQIENKEDLMKRKELMEKARQELPYTFTVPDSYEEFKQLLENQKPDYQSIILERLIKCNHWTLGQGNREKLCKVFEYLLKYIIDSACASKIDNIVKCFEICDRLCPYLFDLAQASAQNTAQCVQAILKEKFSDFKKQPKKYPGLDVLIIFKLVSLLFPTSDFRHPVVTPCLVFMSQILLRCQVKKKTDISKGLFVVTLILEYTLMSKRFSPAAINYLRGIIYLATIKPLILPKIIPPFKRSGEYSSLLILDHDQSKLKINANDIHMRASDLIDTYINDNFKIRTFITTINLISDFKNQLENLEAVYSIFEPIIKLLELNNRQYYPENIREHVNTLCEDLKKLGNKKLEYIAREKKKPKALRLYEPRIERVFDGKKYKPMSKEKAEREKLLHKLKREKKGAMREIRRDATFLAKVQIKNQIRSDEERKRKVKEIYGDASIQQGELNKIKRIK